VALIDNYNLSRDGDFQAKLIAALANKVNIEVKNIPKSDPNYPMYIRIGKTMLSADAPQAQFIAQSAAAASVNPNDDVAIQTFIDNNFDTFAKMFDPDVPGTD
jgi:hypothetical protein